MAQRDQDKDLQENPLVGQENEEAESDVHQRISTLKETLKLVATQMQLLIDMQPIDKGKRDEEGPVVSNDVSDLEVGPCGISTTRAPKWQLKDLKPPKCNGNLGHRTTDAVEQWLSKWEHCFRLCAIDSDDAKIQHATYNLIDAAHHW